MCNYVILCWRHWRRLDISSVWFLCVTMWYYVYVIDVASIYPRCDFQVYLWGILLTLLTSTWHILGVISMCNYVILYWRHWRRLDISSVWFLCVRMGYYIDVIDVALTYPRCDFYVQLCDIILTSLTLPWHFLGVISMCNYVILYWRHWRRLNISSVWYLRVTMGYYIDAIDVALTYPRCDFYV